MSSPIYDVVVCGGGSAGVAAAVAAVRNGTGKVLLIERYGFAGGMATAALVNPWAGHIYHDPDSGAFGSLIRGCFEQFAMDLHRHGGYGSALTQSPFDEDLLKIVYDDALQHAGVSIRYHTMIIGATVNGTRISHLTVQSKQGEERITGRHFIDATGDGDVACFAGNAVAIGREGDGKTQAMTTNFRMGGVDKTAFATFTGHRTARALIEPFFQDAIRNRRLTFPFREFVHFYDYPRPGVLHFNMTRINDCDPLSMDDLTYAEVEGRRQALLLATWLKQEAPAFENAYLDRLPSQIGVRESRHIKGHYTVTKEDIVAARKFPDGIVRSRYFIDIHNPTGAGFQHEVAGTKGLVSTSYEPPKDDWYEVPYRALIAEGVDNLLVPCRALSATHEAAAAIRVMATMTGTGEAAGVAGGIAVQKGQELSDVDGRAVRAALRYLDEPPAYGAPWCHDIQQEQFHVS